MRTAILALLLSAAGAAHGICAEGPPRVSHLAYRVLEHGDEPRLILAQRVIDRSWGPSEDSTYTVIDIPGWRSEGVAFALSGVVPGAGQLYAGEGSGVWFALAELAGLSAHFVYQKRADRLRRDADGFVGSPFDSASNWSFARWSQRTRQDPGELAVLYRADRDAFYDRISDDPRYAAGWSGTGDATSKQFRGMRDHVERYLARRRTVDTALWIHHLVAAFDAVRAVRNNNLLLQRDLELRLRSDWGRSGVQLTAALEKRF